MSVSILVVDDDPDEAELFRQQFLRETRQGAYVLHQATSGVDALDPRAGDERRRRAAGGGRRAAEFGATEFLTEPVDFEHLKAQLRNCPAAWIEEDRRPIE